MTWAAASSRRGWPRCGASSAPSTTRCRLSTSATSSCARATRSGQRHMTARTTRCSGPTKPLSDHCSTLFRRAHRGRRHRHRVPRCTSRRARPRGGRLRFLGRDAGARIRSPSPGRSALPTAARRQRRRAICTLVLTHLPDLGPAFTELMRVVRQGGTIITSDVLSLYLGGVAQADGKRMPATRYFASDYIRAATAADLEIVTCLEPRWGAVEGGGGPLANSGAPLPIATHPRPSCGPSAADRPGRSSLRTLPAIRGTLSPPLGARVGGNRP
jgi:hypothetical protein